MWAALTDLRLGARMLRTRPTLSLTAIVALALGIGLTTAMFSIVYGLLGGVYAVAAYQVPALIVAFVIASTGIVDLIRPSVLIQFAVGISISVIAYNIVSNRSMKFGMLVCYGLIIGTLFLFGGYTILTSVSSL